ncbi:FAST kinase domain-containing protein 1, mitochondrial [Pseudolycoriella hygida]|uniref:FAST kinase domain-containing protein 1, mitochondrial n=1 Tax=Pseudolycoriella hygida TaxID=35572 RepID=A0A9Q0MNI9_9DIPT|nr:FAST kinase domain-containing protein 1, mitochondrial [Pseudolycoriella hygida]
MLRAFFNARATITLCKCLPKKLTISPKSSIFYQKRIQNIFNFHSRKHGSVSYSNTIHRSYCTSSTDLHDDGHEADGIESTMSEIFDDSHEYFESELMQIKNYLYGDFDDEFLVEINNCSCEDELLKEIESNSTKLTQQLAVLALVKLWQCTDDNVKIVNTEREGVEILLRNILQFCDRMTLDELCFCFLYLTRLSVQMQTDVMTDILETILKKFKNSESSDISLSTLSRFAVAVNMNPQLYTNFICQTTLPHIYYHLNRVTSSNDLRSIIISLSNMNQLISSDLLELFKTKVRQLLSEDKLKEDVKTILKILQFCSYKGQDELPLTRMLMVQLLEKIPTLSLKELELVGMIFKANFEPAVVGPIIVSSANKFLESHVSVEAMSCAVLDLSPGNRLKLTKLAKELLCSENHLDGTELLRLFKVLRFLKISDVSICNEYWSRIRKEILANPSHREGLILARHCHQYMYFNNNLNGTYRHIGFEKAVVKILIDELDNGVTSLLPSKFARTAAFILAYGHTPRSAHIFPEYLLQKIEAMKEQFTVFDCLQLTRGIGIAFHMRFKHQTNSELASQIVRLENVFNYCTNRHLQKDDLTLNELNNIARSYASRKSPMRTKIYRNIIKKYETLQHHPLTSRNIRDATFNLNVSKSKIVNLCDSLSEYIIANRDFVLGDTVHKVLFCFYNLNYQPKDDSIFQHAAAILNRDFDSMSGLAVTETCLALGFFKELPGTLIDRVFNITFIQRLEDEIAMCYSKEFYPQRVLNSVMQLNRTVCLDFPENGVPWFQQNYIEAQLTKVPLIGNKFHTDFKRILIDFIVDEKLLKVNHVTPYGYRIDFVLYFDKYKKLLKPPTLNDAVHQVNKLAILLLNSESFCQNNHENLRGKEALKKRHLEIMGFKVAQVSYLQWNSMYMSLPGAKANYVKELLS